MTPEVCQKIAHPSHQLTPEKNTATPREDSDVRGNVEAIAPHSIGRISGVGTPHTYTHPHWLYPRRPASHLPLTASVGGGDLGGRYTRRSQQW